MEVRRTRVRLRQAVFVATELEPAIAELRSELGVGEPFRDPGVAMFGLKNAVFALGDCFLEIVSPAQPDTAAGRYLARNGGDGGYMAMFDLEDLDGARERARRAGVRVVWEIDLPDISGTHLHPRDMPGAIVSIDGSKPYGSWRWGGPSWTAAIGEGAPGRLTGITIAVPDPGRAADRWAEVLGVTVERGSSARLDLDDGEVRFRSADPADREGLVEISLELPAEVRRDREEVELGGVLLRLTELG